MGPRPHSGILNAEQEAVVVAFRKHTLLPLDDCLYALQTGIPHLTRSSLHRCFVRHGINRLADPEGRRPDRKKFRGYPVGYFHIDLAEVRTAEGKLYLFVAIDRTSKSAFVRLVRWANRRAAADFLRELVRSVPCEIHTVLAGNGTRFTTPGNPRSAARDIQQARQRGELFRAHSFELACADHSIDHRLTKPNHPWTNGQVERMNRTIKDGHRPHLPLPPSRAAPRTPRRLHPCLQLRQTAQNPLWPYPVPIHLLLLRKTTSSLLLKSSPPLPGTKQLTPVRCPCHLGVPRFNTRPEAAL